MFDHYIKYGSKEKRITRDTVLLNTSFKNGQTIVIVSHDTEVGGAQQVVLLFAKWILSSTPFSVKFIAIGSGNWRYKFEDIASCLVLSDYQPIHRQKAIDNWLDADTSICFINSIASVEILNYLPCELPKLSFIHEMPKVLENYTNNVELLRINNVRILAGSQEVGKSFVCLLYTSDAADE